MASLVDRRKEPTRSPLADVLAVLDGGAPGSARLGSHTSHPPLGPVHLDL